MRFSPGIAEPTHHRLERGAIARDQHQARPLPAEFQGLLDALERAA